MTKPSLRETQQTLRDSIEKTILICIKEAVKGEVVDQDNCYDGATDILSAIKRAIPKKQKMGGDVVGQALATGYNEAIDDFTKAVE